MQFFKASILAALVASVAALQVNSPAKDAQVDFSKDVTVTWSSVSSDPSSFSVQLVNMAVNPSVTVNIQDGVKTSDGSYTIKAGSVTPAEGKAYQINLVSKETNNSGILAQSQQFSVTSSASASSSTAPSSSAASTLSTAASSAKTSAASVTSAASTKATSAVSGAASASSASNGTVSHATVSATGSASATSSGVAQATANAAVAQSASGIAALGLLGMFAAILA